ncbi:hypothetical protein QBC44DRAFT_402070 [Cladorrhinum sp. PSN332]|nr:hypothetical protein QBC44DRAFT_402070 [Cladorrhinum sp. PSN332]
MRKPLNAFLGELFFGHWSDGTSTARMITEQVSHQPPITACYMWDEEHGIRGTGYVRVEMSFNGSLNVKQTGHEMLHLGKYDEHYLIPFPDSSGQWSGSFTISNPRDDSDTETWGPDSSPPVTLRAVPLADQDPWETRNAWKEVLAALTKGDIHTTIKEKSKLEEAQRAMRRREAAESTKWEPKFFSSAKDDALFHQLATTPGWKLEADRTKGVWRFGQEKARKAAKPYHGKLTPFGEIADNERKD